MDTTQPTVIICHASEDKNSFVIPFTYKLAEYGVRSQVDEWELQQNDSIIEKIFTEGIKNASAFLIILSNLSAHKPWVTEELRPGLIKRIAVHCKIVPVLIENAELPEVLNTGEWVKIRDLDNYDREIQQIVRIIREDLAKPAAPIAAPAPTAFVAPSAPPSIVAPPKPLAQTVDSAIPGLSPSETIALKISNEYAVEKGRTFINTSDIRRMLEANGLTPQVSNKSLDLLDEKGLIKAARIMGTAGVEIFNVTPYGFEAYARAFIPGYDELAFKMLNGLANEGLATNDDLASRFNIPMSVVNFTLDVFETKNLIKKGKSLGGAVLVKNVTDVGKRLLEGK